MYNIATLPHISEKQKHKDIWHTFVCADLSSVELSISSDFSENLALPLEFVVIFLRKPQIHCYRRDANPQAASIINGSLVLFPNQHQQKYAHLV